MWTRQIHLLHVAHLPLSHMTRLRRHAIHRKEGPGWIGQCGGCWRVGSHLVHERHHLLVDGHLWLIWCGGTSSHTGVAHA